MFEAKKPILGICRGEQVLNVYFGGTLYQDLSYKKGEKLKHNQKSRPHLETHTVQIEKHSKLFQIFEKEYVLVNSFHHMAIKDVAEGFKVVATTRDGVVEAIEMEGEDVIGVQWHPEMLSKTNPLMSKLFNYFVSISKKV